MQKSLSSINLTGDVTGSAAYISGALTVAVTISPNSVALGTDTTGDYVAGVVSGTGITVSSSGGEGSSPSVALKNAANLSDNTLPIWDGAAGNLKNSPIQFNGSDIIINANFVVNGTTTTVNTETVLLADNIITLNSNYTGSAPTENAGIEVERGNRNNAQLVWDESENYWAVHDDSAATKTGTLSTVVALSGTLVNESGELLIFTFIANEVPSGTKAGEAALDEVVKALATPEVKERFTTLGADAWTMKPEQFDAYIRDEIKSNAILVKAAGLSPAP